MAIEVAESNTILKTKEKKKSRVLDNVYFSKNLINFTLIFFSL